MRQVLGLAAILLLMLAVAGFAVASWHDRVIVDGEVTFGVLDGRFVSLSVQQTSPGHGNWLSSQDILDEGKSVRVVIWRRGTGNDLTPPGGTGQAQETLLDEASVGSDGASVGLDEISQASGGASDEASTAPAGANPYTLQVDMGVRNAGTIPMSAYLPFALEDPGYDVGVRVFGEGTAVGPGDTSFSCSAIITVGAKQLQKDDPITVTIRLNCRQWSY